MLLLIFFFFYIRCLLCQEECSALALHSIAATFTPMIWNNHLLIYRLISCSWSPDNFFQEETWVVSFELLHIWNLKMPFIWKLTSLVQPFAPGTSIRTHASVPFFSSLCWAKKVVPASVLFPFKLSVSLFLPEWLKWFSFFLFLNIFNTNMFSDMFRV